MNRNLLGVVVLLASLSASAEGRWTFSAGPAWRSRVKLETHGTANGNPLADSVVDTRVRDFDNVDAFDARQQDEANWGLSATADPKAGSSAPPDSKVWQTSAEWQRITTVGGDSSCSINDSETESPLGLTLQGGYDGRVNESLAVGIGLRFAGYWNMRSSSACSSRSSTVRTETFASRYRFMRELYTGDEATDLERGVSKPETKPYVNDPVDDTGAVSVGDGRTVTTRLRSDLYQIGLGPKVTWTPFLGVCDSLDWLDVYGGVEVLCNLAHSKFEADGQSSSQTDCLLGFGGNVGLVGNITDWCGIYGQVGYEWIDRADVSTGGFTADIDYSSLVLSAGVQFRF